MGSVSDDYKCPWCGRTGNGGYAPDGIHYPICTEGDYSCLWYQVMEQQLDREQFQKRAFEVVLTVRRVGQRVDYSRAFIAPDIVACISKFLVGPSKRQRSEPAPTASTPSISETTQKPGTSEPAPTASTPGTSEPAPDASANAESEASADASSAPTAPAPARAPAPTPAPPSQHQSQPDPHKRQPDPLELEEHWETLRELQRW